MYFFFQESKKALEKFNSILDDNPDNPAAILGKARALKILSNKEQSLSTLHACIDMYKSITRIAKESRDKVTDDILKNAGIEGIEIIHSLGMITVYP